MNTHTWYSWACTCKGQDSWQGLGKPSTTYKVTWSSREMVNTTHTHTKISASLEDLRRKMRLSALHSKGNWQRKRNVTIQYEERGTKEGRKRMGCRWPIVVHWINWGKETRRCSSSRPATVPEQELAQGPDCWSLWYPFFRNPQPWVTYVPTDGLSLACNRLLLQSLFSFSLPKQVIFSFA